MYYSGSDDSFMAVDHFVYTIYVTMLFALVILMLLIHVILKRLETHHLSYPEEDRRSLDYFSYKC